MKYFFILGNNPTLSIAEISAVFPSARSGQVILGNIFILEANKNINAKKLIKRLGGTIKIGIIDSEIKKPEFEAIKKISINLIDKQEKTGKFKFGISYYGNKKFNEKKLGMKIKKYLKEKSISCRWVISKEKTLSSVVVEQNKLTSKGLEIVLINPSLNSPPQIRRRARGEVLIGETLAVQAFKELSFRDYGRPARDDKSGMLPPKLAQIMINLAVHTRHGASLYGASILDPFCGSGTILTEAMLMGYKNLIGSDISQKAISGTEKNINWIKTHYPLSSTQYQLQNKPVNQLSAFLKPNSIDTIITEPYLGPQRGKINFKKTIPELEQLYAKALKEFKKVLKLDGIVVIIFPVFNEQRTPARNAKPSDAGGTNSKQINPNLGDFKIINPIPKQFLENKKICLTKRQTIIYGRPGQKIWREIVILIIK